MSGPRPPSGKWAHWLDRIRNWWAGPRHPHWCSRHQRFYNAEVFRDCPDCLAEQGPFYRPDRRPSD